MSAAALKRRVDRLTQFSGGPPQSPYLHIERVIVERRADGSLWRKPFRRCGLNQPLTELQDGEWEQIEPPAADQCGQEQGDDD